MRIKELKKIIHEADYAYYELSKPIMSDSSYDKLVKELFELTGVLPNPSGFLNEKFTKIKHDNKMLSLENSYSIDDINRFKNNILKQYENWNKEIVVQNKLDGLACSLKYKEGRLIVSTTRGNGEIGEDITENVLQCDNVPLLISENIDCEIRGELIISKTNFIKINSKLDEDKKYSNPRNLCSGTMRTIDSNSIKERNVEFVPYYFKGKEFKNHSEEIDYIEKLGFNIDKLNSIVMNIDSIEFEIKNRFNSKPILDYEIDGMVLKINSVTIQEELGYTSKFPKHSIAYKFETEKVETKIISIDYQIGKTGIITPVANLESVEITGTIVKRASLHNFDEISRKDIRIGDTVLVEKAAEIIPYISESIKTKRTGTEKEISIPENCPYCNSKIIQFKDTAAYCCSNENCDEIKIQKLIYQTSKDCLDINGLSEKTIRTFYELGFLKSLKDLIYLHELKEQLYFIKGFGKKSIDKILNSISESKKKEAWIILNTLDIHLIGRSMSKKLLNEIGDIKDILNLTKEELCKINDFSEASFNSIENWKLNENNLNNLQLFIDNGYKTKKENLTIIDKQSEFYNKTICITGSFQNYNRTELSNLLELKGAKITSSISKKTDLLICGENAGSKLEKAEKLKIKIIKEGELIV